MTKAEDPDTGKEGEEQEEVINILEKLPFSKKQQKDISEDDKIKEKGAVLADAKEGETNRKDMVEREGNKKDEEA